MKLATQNDLLTILMDEFDLLIPERDMDVMDEVRKVKSVSRSAVYQPTIVNKYKVKLKMKWKIKSAF